MRRAERIVFAFRPLGEAGEAAALAKRADAVFPAREDLVGIGLVADVPDHPVAGRIEKVVEGDRELDDAEARAQVAACDGDRLDRLLAQFIGDLTQIAFRQLPQVSRCHDLVKKGFRALHGILSLATNCRKKGPTTYLPRIAATGLPGSGAMV